MDNMFRILERIKIEDLTLDLVEYIFEATKNYNYGGNFYYFYSKAKNYLKSRFPKNSKNKIKLYNLYKYALNKLFKIYE